MSDNEIRKALERCPQHTECCYCNSLEECGNKRILTTSVLDLIHRKNAEIERLNAISEICGDCHRQYAEKIEKAKSEAIKEFAERLKIKVEYGEFYDTTDDYIMTVEHIDNLVKEMEGSE